MTIQRLSPQSIINHPHILCRLHPRLESSRRALSRIPYRATIFPFPSYTPLHTPTTISQQAPTLHFVPTSSSILTNHHPQRAGRLYPSYIVIRQPSIPTPASRPNNGTPCRVLAVIGTFAIRLVITPTLFINLIHSTYPLHGNTLYPRSSRLPNLPASCSSKCQYISFSPSASYILGILACSMRRWTPMIQGISASLRYLARVQAMAGA